MAKSLPVYQEPTHEEITACAHSIWESEGCPSGRETENWLQAEAHLIATRKMDAGLIKERKKRKKILKGFHRDVVPMPEQTEMAGASLAFA